MHSWPRKAPPPRAGRFAARHCGWLPGLACAGALAQPLPAQPLPAQLDNCYGPPPLHIAGLPAAWLGDEDRDGMAAAMRARFAALDGNFAPRRILLWQRGPGDWVYVSLRDDPRQSGDQCFDATFSGAAFDATPALMRKYFGFRQAAR